MDLFKNKYRIESARHPGWDYSQVGAYFITICTDRRRRYFGAVRHQEMQLSAIGHIVEEEWAKTPAIRKDMNLVLGAWMVMPDHFHAVVIIPPRRDAMPGVSTPKPPHNAQEKSHDPTSMKQDGNDEKDGRSSGLLIPNDPKIIDGAIDDAVLDYIFAHCFADAQDRGDDGHGVTTGILGDARHGVSTGTLGDDGHGVTTGILGDARHGVSTGARKTPGPNRKNLASIIRGFKSAVTIRARKINPAFKWQPRFHDRIIRDKQALDRISQYIRNNPKNWKG